MELQEVIEHVRSEYKSELAKDISLKLVLLGAENIKYVKNGKYSFDHGINVGQTKALSWVLERLKDMEKLETIWLNEKKVLSLHQKKI